MLYFTGGSSYIRCELDFGIGLELSLGLSEEKILWLSSSSKVNWTNCWLKRDSNSHPWVSWSLLYQLSYRVNWEQYACWIQFKYNGDSHDILWLTWNINVCCESKRWMRWERKCGRLRLLKLSLLTDNKWRSTLVLNENGVEKNKVIELSLMRLRWSLKVEFRGVFKWSVPCCQVWLYQALQVFYVLYNFLLKWCRGHNGRLILSRVTDELKL